MTRSIRVGALVGSAAALAGNALVCWMGKLGSPIRVVTGWAPDGADLTFTEVVATTIVVVAAGSGLLWLMTGRHPDRAQIWVGSPLWWR